MTSYAQLGQPMMTSHLILELKLYSPRLVITQFRGYLSYYGPGYHRKQNTYISLSSDLLCYLEIYHGLLTPRAHCLRTDQSVQDP